MSRQIGLSINDLIKNKCMQIHTSTIIFMLLAACAWVVLSYSSYAERKGWPVGEWFASDTSLIKVASFIGLPGSAIAAAYLARWWSALVVLLVGFFVALLLTKIFKKNVQPLVIIGSGYFGFWELLFYHRPNNRLGRAAAKKRPAPQLSH
jgi:hypothetical protein